MLWPDLGIGQNDRAELSEIQNKIRNAAGDVSRVEVFGLNRVRAKAADVEGSQSQSLQNGIKFDKIQQGF